MGHGIRFVVFMQGCILKCKYCQNRDTWNRQGGREYTIDEIIKKIKREKSFIDASQGGVTISGGEPLLQANFILELFKELKKQNISTAIDTSGAIKINKTIIDLLKYTDLVLLDIKHIDEGKSIELTGLSNKNELEFAKYCSDNKINLWIRQVLIPKYTDNKEDLEKTYNFIKTLKTVKKVEILPYHNLGKYKWERLGLKYPFEEVSTPSIEDIEKAKKILNIKE